MASNHKQTPARLTRFLPTETATLALGAALAPGLQPGMVIYLCGDLGSGKTTLARGILRALGVTESIKSPTFTLVEPYTISSLYLYHFDFYRFTRSDEWVDAGLREYFNSESVCLIEWPEKAGGELPAPDLRIEIDIDGSGRSVTIMANTEAGRHCLMRVQR
ncbi:MAG TPA: tRNA (adenosine(37)-N6)-threonylcarbamoyltransferase complex ATPase subunit type 1 TsaE [Burkholderiales bacterium]|jgi:tRNA threonylcarbamoyladenosine biosynthesis protein TsaE|nr:tRNA (adenosine(37)-N6)-threonylcarbamoyltransferase complex ATPase subunit type 1 TsaE [Burkholderiales bacterium]